MALLHSFAVGGCEIDQSSHCHVKYIDEWTWHHVVMYTYVSLIDESDSSPDATAVYSIYRQSSSIKLSGRPFAPGLK